MEDNLIVIKASIIKFLLLTPGFLSQTLFKDIRHPFLGNAANHRIDTSSNGVKQPFSLRLFCEYLVRTLNFDDSFLVHTT